MNETISSIKNRRSIRKFLPDPVPKEVILELIEAAKYAPSSHNRQPWNFTIITDKAVIDGLSQDIRGWYDSLMNLSLPLSFIQEVRKSVREMRKRVNSDQDLFFYNAPALIIIHAPNKEFFCQDCSCAAENILIAARSLGLGSCWIGFADIVFNKGMKMKRKLHIPVNHRVMATIALGYPIKFPENALPRKEPKIDWI
ncbi:MAG: nitroreductase family protein [Nanoarchaeota archaeon]|nr:nitroreductase family protein [Nanoarchaeota archaeon]